MSNSQVAHRWAQQSTGRSSYGRSGNMLFDGECIYSYGHHWLIARFLTSPKGRVVLINNNARSVSTAKHTSEVRGALHGLPNVAHIFHVRYPNPSTESDHNINIDSMVASAVDASNKAKRARTRSCDYLREAKELLSEARAYATWFDVSSSLLDTAESSIDAADSALAERIRAQRVAREQSELINAKKREAELALRRLQQSEQFELWKKGTLYAQCPYSYQTDSDGSAYLRVLRADSVDDAIVETSRGAEVPLRHALRLFAFARKCRESAQAFEANGHTVRVGHFQVTSIDASGNVRIGCHYLSWLRLSECAETIGALASTPASDEALEPTEAHAEREAS